MTDHADLTKHGPWRAERVWSKHHERIPDRWEWLIEDDAGVVAIVPADDPEHAEAVARFIAEAADALDAGLILDGDGLAWPCLTCQREDAG